MASTDATREIAASHGAKIIDVPLAPVVEPARNLAVSHCHGEWVLVVDADERVMPALAERLRALKAKNGVEAYAIPRRNYFLGQWLEFGFWPDYQVRFFRKGSVVWSDKFALPIVSGTLIQLPADPHAALEHPGYGNDLTRFISKLVRYSPLEAQYLLEVWDHPLWPYFLRRPMGEFYGRYIRSEAWRHGMNGLVWSLLMAFYQLLVNIHCWALLRQSNNNGDLAPDKLRRKVRWEVVRSFNKWLRP
jgi:glycosyltransferase involved in cell wall biosynthesis